MKWSAYAGIYWGKPLFYCLKRRLKDGGADAIRTRYPHNAIVGIYGKKANIFKIGLVCPRRVTAFLHNDQVRWPGFPQ